ncbi:myb-like protein X [Myxocyprinus asiaticus]|uniref:myb-like protein X n=1 Tax=Myxocyprinus asiaticus TaxID=70543 RepID=UPI0022212D95|nr:myb-like protein X [Myxocyprinus asiaticus]
MNSMKGIDLDTCSLSLLTAKEDILNPRSSTNWALFAYDGIMNRLKLADSGVGGLEELKTKFHPRRALYGMCSVGKSQPRNVMILWLGKEVDEYRKAECASHLPAIRAFFKEVHIFLPAHTMDEITEERICTLACKAAVTIQGPRGRHGLRRLDREEVVGTNYKRTIAAAEILRLQRDSFWAQAEKEEEERKIEEQRRAAEDRRQRERERIHQEKREAMERERKMNEKEQKFQEQRRIQAKMEAEAHRQERIKWEAAALMSQRVTNSREFFRQLSSSSGVQPGSHPGSPFPARSTYRQLHRSQTDNVFIFKEPSSFTPTSPYRLTVASPYIPSTPKSQSPTLVFPSPTMDSTSLSEKNFPTDSSVVSSNSHIHPSSLKLMESSCKSTLQLQTQPTPLTNATESEIKTPITAILDSFIFYPSQPATELLQPNNQGRDEPVTFPSPLSGLENSPKPSTDLPKVQTSMQTQLDISLTPQTISDPPVFSSDLLTSSLLQSCPSSLDTSCVLVPQPPSRPLPALPVIPRLLKDLEPEREFTARASVITMVEEEEDVMEENEEKDGERDEEERINEERVGEIRYEGKRETEEKHGVRGCLEEGKRSGEDKAEKSDSGEKRNGEQLKQDWKIMEEHESKKEQDRNIMEEYRSEEEQAGKNVGEHDSEKDEHWISMKEFVSEKEQYGKNMKEFESEKEQDGKTMEESKNEKEQNEEIMKKFEREKDQDGKNTEELENETIQDGNIRVEYKSEEEQDGNTMEVHESEKDKDWESMEEFKSEKEQDGKTMEEYKNEKEQDEEIIKEFENEKEQDGKTMGEFKNEEEQCGKNMEELESEKIQDGNIMEEYKSEEEQDGNIMKIHENEKDKDWKSTEEFKSEKEQDGKTMEESKNEKEQDEEIIKEFENEKEQDGKTIGEFQNEEEQCGINMEELESEKIQDGNIMEEYKSEEEHCWNPTEVHENEKDDNWKSMKEYESKKEQDGKTVEEFNKEQERDEEIMKEFESEKEQDGKTIGEFENEKEQCGKNMEELESEKKKDGNIMEEYKSEEEQGWNTMEVQESEKDEDWKSRKECESEKEQDGKTMGDSENEEEQCGKNMEELESEIIQDGNTMEAHESENNEDWKSVEEFENKKDNDWKSMEECESKKEQDGKTVEESNKEQEQVEEIMEEFESKKEQDGKTIGEFENEIEQCGKNMEELESEKIQDGNIMEEYKSEEEQDGNIMKVHENEKDKDWKSTEEFKNKKEQDGKTVEESNKEQEQVEEIMKECESAKEQDGKTIGEFENDKEQRERNMEELESEKIQDGNTMEAHERENDEDGNIMEESENEKEQDGKIMENCEGEKDSRERGNNQEENSQTLLKQSEEKLKVDIEKESQREIVLKNDAVDEENIEKIAKGNEKEERNTSLIKTVEAVEVILLEEHPSSADKNMDESFAETLFSQHAPPFREFSAIEPSQYNHTSLPTSISTNQDENEPHMSSTDFSHLSTDMQISLPTVQHKSDLSKLIIQSDSQPDDVREVEFESDSQDLTLDFLTVISCSQESSCPMKETSSTTLTQLTTEQGLKSEAITDICVSVEDVMGKEECKETDGEMGAKIVDHGNDLAEEVSAEKIASPIFESQAKTGQSDEEEGLVTVRNFLEGPDVCITHQSELDSTNEMSDSEEGEEAISLIVHDTHTHKVEQSSNFDSAPELNRVNSRTSVLQNGKTATETPNNISNDKKADESLTSGRGNEHLEIIEKANLCNDPCTANDYGIEEPSIICGQTGDSVAHASMEML